MFLFVEKKLKQKLYLKETLIKLNTIQILEENLKNPKNLILYQLKKMINNSNFKPFIKFKI